MRMNFQTNQDGYIKEEDDMDYDEEQDENKEREL